MKKVSAGLLTVLFLGVSAGAWAAEGCTVNNVLGDAMVMREGKEMAAKKGDALMKGDGIKTSPTCQVDMSMNNLAGCRVLSGTEVKVMGWKPENMSLKVESGNVILNLKELPAKSSFRVETPTAVATVRGTQFWGRVNPSADSTVTTFAVKKGSVEILPVGIAETKPILLAPGDAVDISPAGAQTRKALPEEMAAMEQADQVPNEA